MATTQSESSKPTLTGNSSMATVVAHPLRARIWTVLTERTASAKELEEILGEKLGNIAYHVRILKGANFIEPVKQAQRRGATETWYRAIVRPNLSAEDTAARTPEERTEFAEYVLQRAFADATVALQAGTFVERPDHIVARMPIFVDEEGWRELSAIYEECAYRTMEAQAKSSARAAESGGEAPGIAVTGLVSVFEVPTPER